MAYVVPFKKLLEKEIRKVIEASATMEPAERLDALKLGVDWQKAMDKSAGDESQGAFFAEGKDDE